MPVTDAQIIGAVKQYVMWQTQRFVKAGGSVHIREEIPEYQERDQFGNVTFWVVTCDWSEDLKHPLLNQRTGYFLIGLNPYTGFYVDRYHAAGIERMNPALWALITEKNLR